MPAAASDSMLASRARPEAALGSSSRLRSVSRVVMLIATEHSPSAAMSARISISLVTSAPLVMMATGWRWRCSTSSNCRVMRYFFSTGWYGSVLAPSVMQLQV